MSSPPPGAPAAAAATSADDWRRSVPQSHRSGEVRNIAQVLASLEPGATSASKLMLAMRFEDAIFQSASSLSDYRKRLTKRLKKVIKECKKNPAAAASAAAAAALPPILEGLSPAEIERREELEAERSLRDRFGAELRFICNHAAEAVEAMREKHGSSRAEVLRQHTDNAEQWAAEIGLTGVDTPSFRARRRRAPREAGYLDRLKAHLEQRVDNIRSHVVKLTRPDLFLEETLVRLEDDMDDRTADELASVADRCLRRLGLPSPAAPAPAGEAGGGTAARAAEVRRLLERASAPVPIPRRSRRAGDVRDASLAHVERIRAASQALVNYTALGSGGKAEVRGILKRAHAAAVESVSHIVEAFREEELEGRAAGEIRLEDAWNRSLECAPEEDDGGGGGVGSGGESGTGSGGEEPDRKRQRTGRPKIVVRSRVLLAPGRKVPYNLLVALKRKRAELICPPTNVADYASTRLRLTFGSAFEMVVNFTPLLVTIRALPNEPADGASAAGKEDAGDGVSEFRRTIVDGGLPTWAPPFRNLHDRRTPLSVLGASGRPETLGHLVASKLEYASCQATRVLRMCFADVAGKAYANPSGSDFEVEISEATALLRFLQIARSTYCPGWQDADS